MANEVDTSWITYGPEPPLWRRILFTAAFVVPMVVLLGMAVATVLLGLAR